MASVVPSWRARSQVLPRRGLPQLALVVAGAFWMASVVVTQAPAATTSTALSSVVRDAGLRSFAHEPVEAMHRAHQGPLDEGHAAEGRRRAHFAERMTMWRFGFCLAIGALAGVSYGLGQHKGGSTSLQRECSRRTRSRKTDPPFENAPRDDRSSKNQPKRVEEAEIGPL